MSQEVQLSPATSNSPIVILLSSSSAGHVTEAPAAAAAHRTGQAGQPPDCHISEIRFERLLFTALPQIPGPHWRGGTDPHGHARSRPSSPPPRARSAATRSRQYPAGQALSQAARAHRTSRRTALPPSQPGRGRPAKLLTAIDRRCSSDVLASTSRRPAPPPGAGQRRDHVGAVLKDISSRDACASRPGARGRGGGGYHRCSARCSRRLATWGRAELPPPRCS